ncbi:aryl-sulfate sulfotransferase [Tatumella terrea]|uniref:aryl-sulfate sulfotransferase n=1 Tax=Tatumella terrea TaxID=419007 RepID=UPI0031D8FB67
MGYPSVYPTGATLFDPLRTWSGYTLFQATEHGAVLIDMNGNVVREWPELHGFPNKMLPGGFILGHSGQRDPRYGMQDMVDLIQVDWEGNITWKFDHYEEINDPQNPVRWMARAHHDYQRTGNPVGYYAPGLEPRTESGNTLILAHTNLINRDISDKCLLDDTIIEVNWAGEIIWEWRCSDHFHELGFDEAARTAIRNNPNMRASNGGMGDWMHINSMSTLGPNKWYDAGDTRFHPDNIIWDARESNIIAIIDKKSGKIVWQLGPDYNKPEYKHLGWIIGQHHAHMIPQGLPGAGNILIFDNGGWAGYGSPNPMSQDGVKNAWRDYSRILEINPQTLDIEWRYSPYEANLPHPTDSYRFYSPYISNMQRLENGNTLINEGSNGRIFEVTRDHEIVWEYISPFRGKSLNNNMVYRAYRIPYDWIPQLDTPQEIAIHTSDVCTLRQPGAGAAGPAQSSVRVAGVQPYNKSADALCVATDSDTLRRSPKLFKVAEETFVPVHHSKELQSELPVLLFVGAERCVHCRKLWHLLNDANVAERLSLTEKRYLDADHHQDLATHLGVRGLPTLLAVQQGKSIARAPATPSLEQLLQWLNDTGF